MLQKISIKGEATFDQVGVVMNDMKQINVIYGSNGTGKSTISKILSALEHYPQCEVKWKDDTPVDMLVYNREFCERNYKEQIPGVFTLGESSVETYQKITETKSKLNEIEDIGKKYQAEISKLQNARDSENDLFRDTSWNSLLKKHEADFSKTAIGAGTKAIFVTKLIDAYNKKSEQSLPLEELKSKAAVVFGSLPELQSLIQIPTFLAIEKIESNVVWGKVIVGKQDVDISGLMMHLGNADWVSQGLRYIEEGSDVCPFCQQHTITSNFRDKIGSFFDETYKQDVDSIERLTEEYRTKTTDMIASFEDIMRTEKSKSKSFVDISALESMISALKAVISGNVELMNSKKKEPGRILTITNSIDLWDRVCGIINDANGLISNNNYLANNFAKERAKTIENVWNYFACTFSETIAAHIKRIADIDKAVKNLNEKLNKAKEDYTLNKQVLTKLENSVTSVTPTINEINRLLKGYGFTNFELKELDTQENFYQIVRENGEIATATLSEGEKTFITFLYYMQLVKGSYSPEGVTNNRVLVIDDPVSSLDSNVLFVISTLLREVFADIHADRGSVKQVIVLTHNVYFHKEISFCNDAGSTWKNSIGHWILRKRDNVSSIFPYGKSNPIKSSYELLWSEYKNANLNSSIVVQNIMRRIIENYFQVFGGISPDVILEQFPEAEDRKICRSLLSWVNDGSHSMPDDLFVEMSDDQLERNKEVFRLIFAKMGQEAHYKMMMAQRGQEDENSVMIV